VSDHKPEELATMPLIEHLTELRKRLIICLVSVFAAFAVCWFFVEKIFEIMMRPMIQVLGDKKMIFTSPTDAFVTYLKVAAMAGFLIATPIWMWELWQFISRGLYPKERSRVVWFVLMSTFLFVGGALFGYFMVIPLGLNFLINNFQSDFFEALPTIKETFAISMKLLIAFGIAFELPIALIFLSRIGLVTSGWLLRNFKFAVLIIFVAAAVFTPPDVITQILLGIPLCLLYLLGVLFAHLFRRRQMVIEDVEGED
jgi:sec-independent protein translocase protein TatC